MKEVPSITVPSAANPVPGRTRILSPISRESALTVSVSPPGLIRIAVDICMRLRPSIACLPPIMLLSSRMCAALRIRGMRIAVMSWPEKKQAMTAIETSISIDLVRFLPIIPLTALISIGMSSAAIPTVKIRALTVCRSGKTRPIISPITSAAMPTDPVITSVIICFLPSSERLFLAIESRLFFAI